MSSKIELKVCRGSKIYAYGVLEGEMELKELVREKMLCEAIAERDTMILNLHAEVMRLRGDLENANKPKGPVLVPPIVEPGTE